MDYAKTALSEVLKQLQDDRIDYQCDDRDRVEISCMMSITILPTGEGFRIGFTAGCANGENYRVQKQLETSIVSRLKKHYDLNIRQDTSEGSKLEAARSIALHPGTAVKFKYDFIVPEHERARNPLPRPFLQE